MYVYVLLGLVFIRPELENEAKLTRKRKVLRQLGAMVSQAVKSIVLNPPYMKASDC